jgi:selT/selW/selH-like putative selenoprotein
VEAEIQERWPDAEVELIEGSRGVFDVIVDGDLVFSKHKEGRYAQDGEIPHLIGARQ